LINYMEKGTESGGEVRLGNERCDYGRRVREEERARRAGEKEDKAIIPISLERRF